MVTAKGVNSIRFGPLNNSTLKSRGGGGEPKTQSTPKIFLFSFPLLSLPKTLVACYTPWRTLSVSSLDYI